MFGILAKKSVGIDISDGSIEVARITRSKALSLGRVILESSIVVEGIIRNEDKLALALKNALLSAEPYPIKTRHAIFALPERQLYSRVVKMRVSPGRSEREQEIREEARKNIPLDGDDLLYTYRVLSEEEVLILAASRAVVREWQQFFHRLKITVHTFDIESLAIARSIFGRVRSTPVCLVDIGTHTTTIAVLDNVGLLYSHSLSVGGAAFTKDVADTLSIQKTEAEDRKILFGVTEKNQKGLFILIKALQPVTEEITTAFRVYQRTTGGHIGQVVFVGGASHMPGLLNYFSENLSLPVIFGKSYIPLKKQNTDITHIEAVGIALKAWAKDDPALAYTPLAGEKKRFLLPHFSFSLDPLKNIFQSRVLTGVIILLALAGIFLFMLFRTKKSEPASLPPQVPAPLPGALSHEQALDFSVELAFTPGAYTSERVRARVIEVNAGGEDALIRSLVESEQGLKSGEKLTKEPLSQSSQSIRWAVYSEEDLSRKIASEINTLIAERPIQYEIKSIEENTLKTTGEETALMSVRVRISASDSIKEKVVPVVPPPPAPPVVVENKVQIKNTETGYLNVREGPGMSYKLLFRVSPGETHILLERKGDWAKIRTKDGRAGWVSGQYVQEIP